MQTIRNLVILLRNLTTKTTKTLALVLSASGALLAGSAGAVSFTLDSPISFSGPGASGTVQAVPGASFGSAVCGAGTCDPGNQDILLFRIEVASGALDALRVSFAPPPFPPPTWAGGGYLDGSGSEPATSFTTSSQSQALFQWTGLAGQSEVLFTTASLGKLANGVPITFTFTPTGASQTFNETIGTVVVPEPTTATLLGLGLLAVAAGRRKGR